MRGLLLKDWFTVGIQAKIYFVMIFVFLLMPTMEWYSVLLGTLLPITVFAYDERCKWDKLARMMPYSARELVMSKYVFGYLMVLASVIVGILIQGLYGVLGIKAFHMQESLQQFFIFASATLLALAVNLPIMFWMGVEKMRTFVTFFSIAVVMVTGTAAFELTEEGTLHFVLSPGIDVIVLALTLAVQFLSIKISAILYQRNVR